MKLKAKRYMFQILDCAAIRTTNEPAVRPILVDVTETQLMGWTSKGVTDSSRRSQYPKPVQKILWYNLPAWLPIKRITEHAKTCGFNNCEQTVNKNILNSSSAIVFWMYGGAAIKQPPLNAHKRHTNQVWIYYGLESPATQERIYKGSIPSWMNSFNWSMIYQLDSDIVLPYGVLTRGPMVL